MLRRTKRIHCDNGSEFAGRLVDLWAYANGVVMKYSRPGKPTDNAYIEAFNNRFRLECLNQHWFLDLRDATMKINAWWQDYNRVRPQGSMRQSGADGSRETDPSAIADGS